MATAPNSSQQAKNLPTASTPSVKNCSRMRRNTSLKSTFTGLQSSDHLLTLPSAEASTMAFEA
eukprot:6356566-Lingulodinium_polyedra.AAC.1